ncbi:MAG: glycoside hydrolase family 3 N-terminal domain-containing protein [Acidobacteriaceae bacterium]|nr:glycoside hydrolase family 3 N-terminal domain-containing protein [Acidobacteriaceae bacterium]
MMLSPRFFLCTVALLQCAFSPALHAQQSTNTALGNTARINYLLGQMTIEEKAGQLTLESGKQRTGPEGNDIEGQESRIAAGQIGSLLNTFDVDRMNKLQHVAVEQSRLHIPLLSSYDVIHGYRTTFPIPLALSATWDTTLIEATARVAAIESSRNGIRWVFSPMVDIARDARWGRIIEGAGEDPYLGSAIAAAYVRGYQGKSLSDPDSVAACVKHFAAYGAVSAGREYNDVDMSNLTLRQFYLPPYRAAVDAGAATVMTAFNALNGVPATASMFLLRDTLRRDWIFQGVTVSDWGAITQLQAHGISTDVNDAARKAMLAGVDVDMVDGVYSKTIPQLVRSHQIPQSVVDEAVRRVLQLKADLGLFDHPYANPAQANQPPSAQFIALAQHSAEESFVLLKNATGTDQSPPLPMKATAHVALIGPLADSRIDMLGAWASQGKLEDVVTLRQALAARLQAAGGTLTYEQGTDIAGASDAGFATALSVAKQADVVILALGESGPQMSGEMGSRTRLDLPGKQQQLLEAVVATGKPVVLVLFNGHPLALPWAAEHVPTILEAWFPGIAAGPALANVILGDVNPSGHLTVTMPRSVGQEPLFYNHRNTGRPVKPYASAVPPDNRKAGFSRYVDELNDPLFPFGYGQSYTTFRISNLKLSAAVIPVSEIRHGTTAVIAEVDLQNSGKRDGADIIQLYIRRTGTSLAEPVLELRGFKRVTLKPGESVHLSFPLGYDDLAVLHADGTSGAEPMQLEVYAGDSSLAAEHAEASIR